MFFTNSKIFCSLLQIATNSDSEPCIAIQPHLYFKEKESSEDSSESEDTDSSVSSSVTNCIKSLSLEMSIDLKSDEMKEINDKYDLNCTEVYLTKFSRKIAVVNAVHGGQIYSPKNVLIPYKGIKVDNFNLYVSPRAIHEDVGNEIKLCQFISIYTSYPRSCEFTTIEILSNFKSLMEHTTNSEYGYRFHVKLKGKNPNCTPKNIYTQMFEVIFPDDGTLPKLKEVDKELFITGAEVF